MLIILLTVVGLALNLSIAYLTAKDAHQRGHDRDKWFVISSVFGIFGIIVYLLTRNDRKIPESERQPKRTKARATYAASAIFVAILLLLISTHILSPLLFPTPHVSSSDSCYDYGTEDWRDEPCEVTETQMNEIEEARTTQGFFIFVSGLFGLIAGPAGMYGWKNDKINI